MTRASAQQRLEEAWPQVLDASGAASVRWVRNVGAATSLEVLGEARHLGSYLGSTPTWDATVVQMGIVDVSPRPLPRRVQRLVEKLPGVRNAINRRMGALLRLRSRPWVSEQEFERTAADLVEAALAYSGSVVFVAIVPPGPGLVAKLGAFSDSVERYNGALRRVAAQDPGRVAVAEPDRPGLLPDGHHLSVEGHRAVAEAVAAALAR